MKKGEKMANKVIAMEIGHWCDPKERNPEKDLWEFKFNFVTAREIKKQLERHGYKLILNGDLSKIDGKGGLEPAFNEWLGGERKRGVLGGYPVREPTDYEKSIEPFEPYINADGESTKELFPDYLIRKHEAGDIELILSISVHYNGSKFHDAFGFEVFRSVYNDGDNENLKKYIDLCEKVENEMKALFISKPVTQPLNVYMRGIKSDNYFMCQLPCPVAYCECGFYDNPEDRKYFDTTQKQKEYGIAIAKGVLKHLGVAWKPFYAFPKYPTAKEQLESIADNSLIIEYNSLKYVAANTPPYYEIHRVSNGNVYVKTDNMGRSNLGSNIYAYGTLLPSQNDVQNSIPDHSLIVVFNVQYYFRNSTYMVSNGNIYYKIGQFGGYGKSESEYVFAFDRFPHMIEYNQIPPKSLIVVHDKSGALYNGKLMRVSNGNIYYKD